MSFIHEDDVKAAYEAAEFSLKRSFRGSKTFEDWKKADFDNMVRRVARDVADAVIRSQLVEGDIADVPGIHVERVN
jgi:predicted PilT family ATPase